MEIKTLWLALCRRHRGSLTGIFILVLLLSLTLLSALIVWKNAGDYVQSEMERLGFGRITAWVSGDPDIEKLTGEITGLSETERVGLQSVIFSEYEVNGQKSDSEGQLITYEPEKYPYKIFTDDLIEFQSVDARIGSGEIYVSPAMQSMFGVKIGDEISFAIRRNTVKKTFQRSFSYVQETWKNDRICGCCRCYDRCPCTDRFCGLHCTGDCRECRNSDIGRRD